MAAAQAPLERSETAIAVDDADVPVTLLRLPSAYASDLLLDALATIVGHGAAALLDRLPTQREIPNLAKPVTELTEPMAAVALVNTLGNCAAVPFHATDLVARAPCPASAWLVGATSTVRYLLASVPETPDPSAVVEAVRIRRDYSPFSAIWMRTQGGALDDPRYAEIPVRPLWVQGIGERMAQLHDMWLLDTDAHEDNFLWRDDDMATTRVDFANSYFVFREPSALQCATTLVPLLARFSAQDYQWFKLGYRADREAKAQRVFDAIELSDGKGWMQASREGKPARAADLVREQIITDEDMDDAWRIELWNALGVFLSHAARHAEAQDAFETAERLARSKPTKLAGLVFNRAHAYLRAGAVSEAVAGFARVRELEARHPTDDRLVAAASQLIAEYADAPDPQPPA